MSLILYPTNQLRFWTENEISLREGFVPRLFYAVKNPLLKINKAWRFDRIEGPLLTPNSYISSAYESNDVWNIDENYTMRAGTTASSYLYAKHLMSQAGGSVKLPLCVYQSGKSFRRESNDGASASKLRFFEFYQLEFQNIYSKTSGADYATPVIESVQKEIGLITELETRLVLSDRLPTYSEKTMDIEVNFNNRWTEMCSISKRIDFSENDYVLEVAVGIDRLVSVI